MFVELLEIFGKIFLMIGYGYLLYKKKVIQEPMKACLTTLLMKVVVPISILSAANHEFSRQKAEGMLFSAVAITLYYVISLVLVSALSGRLGLEERKRKALINLAVFANVGFIGFPLAEELFGADGTMGTVIYNMIYQLFFFSYGVYLYSGRKEFHLSDMLKNVVTLACLGTVILFLSPFRFPAFVQSAMSSVGGMMVPVSMILIGCEIAKADFRKVITDRWGYLVSFFRLVAAPLVIFLILKAVGAKGPYAANFLVISGLPSASLNVIMAQEHRCEPEFAASAVTQSMMWMVATAPVVVMLAQRL